MSYMRRQLMMTPSLKPMGNICLSRMYMRFRVFEVISAIELAVVMERSKPLGEVGVLSIAD